MPINYVKWIDRSMVQTHRESRFVFGDNVAREGYGGQAKAMRGEPNSIGIATKWRPDMEEGAFFNDRDQRIPLIIATDFSYVLEALQEGRTVYVPKDGLGTGLSQLPTRAPYVYAMLRGAFEAVTGGSGHCPWEPATVPVKQPAPELIQRVLAG